MQFYVQKLKTFWHRNTATCAQLWGRHAHSQQNLCHEASTMSRQTPAPIYYTQTISCTLHAQLLHAVLLMSQIRDIRLCLRASSASRWVGLPFYITYSWPLHANMTSFTKLDILNVLQVWICDYWDMQWMLTDKNIRTDRQTCSPQYSAPLPEVEYLSTLQKQLVYFLFVYFLHSAKIFFRCICSSSKALQCSQSGQDSQLQDFAEFAKLSAASLGGTKEYLHYVT